MSFYVYAYLDPRKQGDFVYGDYSFDYEPFYIGKGSNGRMYVHLNEAKVLEGPCGMHRLNKIRGILQSGDEPQIIKVKDNLPERDALELEKRLISLIGRRYINTGPLTNLTAGGDGVSGEGLTKAQRKKRFGRNFSPETRKKIGESREYPTGSDHFAYGGKLYDSLSDEQKERMKRPNWEGHTEEAKRKISKANKGIKRSAEFCRKLSENKKGNTNVLGKHVHTLQGMKERSGRNILRVLAMLILDGKEVNEQNFNEMKFRACPKFERICDFFL